MAIEDVAALIVRPNPGANFSAANYAAKAARWKTLWPEITVLPADASPVGWVERSETHQSIADAMMGFAALYPSYKTSPVAYRTTPEVNPALRRGGLMSFFRKHCASLPA